MITLNAAHLSASKPSSSVARIRCPVEETGRNSVTLSTMPRMIAINRIGTSAGGRQIDMAAAEFAAAMEPAEPLPRHGGERRRCDPESFDAGQLAGRNIVSLKHQPLVARQGGSWKEAKQGDELRREIRQWHQLGLLVAELQNRAVQLLHAHYVRSA